MKLVTLGCSLTHQIGWADYVSACTQLPLVNLSQSAGGNQIQQHRFKEYLLAGNANIQDIVIWQITSTHRKHGRIKLNNSWRKKLAKELYVPFSSHPTITQKYSNLFDGKKRIDFLCTSDCIEDPDDEEQLIEDLLFYLVTAKQFFPKLLIVFGWQRVLPPPYMRKFKKLLNSFNIDYIDEPIANWCEKNKLGFKGSLHPTQLSYQIYGQKVIVPKLNELLGTNFTTIEPWAKECTI